MLILHLNVLVIFYPVALNMLKGKCKLKGNNKYCCKLASVPRVRIKIYYY